MHEASSVNAAAVVPHSNRRGRGVTVAILVAIGLLFLYRYARRCASPRGGRGGHTVGSPRGNSRAVSAAPDANEMSLMNEDADAVWAASGKYGKDYQDKMAQLVAPKREEHCPPFIGFSIADNLRKGALVVDGVFEEGPANEVGVDIDHELVSIAGEPAGDVDNVRRLIASHCHPGHVTAFGFHDSDDKSYGAQIWVMTADERFRGKPYFFDPQAHVVRQSDRLKQVWNREDSPKPAA